MRLRILLASSLIALCNCVSSKVVIPDIEVCAVAGVMAAGADCQNTLSENNRTLSLIELISFLEAQKEPPRGPAIIVPLDGWVKYKTALESLCVIHKGVCVSDVKPKQKIK